MKKTIFIIFFFFLTNECFSQERFDENSLIKEYEIISEEISSTIVKSVEKDSIYGVNSIHIVEYYNDIGKVVKKVKTDPYSSLGTSGDRIEFYKNSKIVVALNQDYKGIIWSLTISKYYENGKLLETKQFDTNKIYKTTFNSDEVKKYFDSNGKLINDIQIAKREVPYK